MFSDEPTDMKEGDTIYADLEPGWSGLGVYMMRSEVEPGKWATLGVGLVDPLTKKGKLRKSLVMGGIRFWLESGYSLPHRVKSWTHPL